MARPGPRLVLQLLLASCLLLSGHISGASAFSGRKLLQSADCGDGVGSCADGNCCSQFGFCGNTADHCGAGCQSAYGTCSGSSDASAQCGDGVGSCGDGNCCSQFGFCGNTAEHCDAGCQSAYGTCSGSSGGGGGNGGSSSGSVVVGYIGARGDPVPSFTDVPLNGKKVYLALSFATEGGDGSFAFSAPGFNPSGNSNLSPENAGQASGSGYFFLIALYGDAYTYAAPSDSAAFASNAVSSIQSLARTWSASGIELNVEKIPDLSFVNVWCDIATQLKAWDPSFIISASPFSATWDIYKQMFDQCGGSIDWFDYQLYAEVAAGDVGGAVSRMQDLGSQVGGLDKLTVGFASNTADPRGLQKDDFVSALQQLQGIRGVNVWSMEDSSNFYQFSDVTAIEAAF